MNELLSECPICLNKTFDPFLKCKDFTVSGESFDIVSCNQCGFKFTNPRPDTSSIGKYYESEDYVSHSNSTTGLINKLYHYIKSIAIRNKIDLIRNLKPNNKKILDIGCGTGSFLGAIKEKGWEVKGIEPNSKARGVAINDFNISVDAELSLQKLKIAGYSVITMWHVLEHVHLLKEKVREIHSLLENDGYAVIAVPNNTSWDAKHYQSFWAAYDVPRHLSHFTPITIKKLFLEDGFLHFKSFPMKFDSFYVSMLSEKYKKSTLGIVKAFINGMMSNLKADNAEKYSSVIYVFKKQ
ncbi:MAG: class I SAM-dependent methyltransferase [bacterium]